MKLSNCKLTLLESVKLRELNKSHLTKYIFHIDMEFMQFNVELILSLDTTLEEKSCTAFKIQQYIMNVREYLKQSFKNYHLRKCDWQ